MTTKRPFIPLLSLVLLLAAGGGTLLALTSDNHSNTIDAASTEPGSASLEEPTGANSTEQPVASSPTEPQPETQRSAQQAQTPQRSPSQTQSPQAPPQAGYDTTVIPGERVGPITRSTTRQDLAALFGEQQLIDITVPVGEGFTEPGVEIALDDGLTLSLIWTDATQSGVREVRDLGPAWRTSEGVYVGMPLSEFEQVAGEFEFYGFGWDYGGTVLLDSSRLAQYDGDLILRMAIDSSQPYQALSGDSQYSSANGGLEALNPYIDEMIVTLTP